MKKENSLTIGLVQHACSTNPQDNFELALAGIREASAQGAQLVLLQELHNSPYFCQTENPRFFDLAETIPGHSTARLGQVAKKQHVVIVASLFERRAAGLFHNTAVVFETDGSIAGLYRKMHIPDDPSYYEKYYFTPGDLGFTPISTSVGRLGVLICWDQWFPEAARLMALAGADLLLYPTAIGWDRRDDENEKHRQQDAWMISQRAHAIANGIPVIVCNRCGFEADPDDTGPGIEFWGSSFIAGPQGELLTVASNDNPRIQIATLNRQHSEYIRRDWPFFRDRRIDAYHDLVKRFRD